eukprot:CAMPEP_0113970604 /NCGR_PEP_ID=MMETSP0011_2-20120614/11365_1 /TAXON_ID=101924 /ORGANISM="Rhodosorus marinus" /LENGTH=34 /DNA_ID=CAMNT_0000985191 /DNA_START=81 /DNA_END=181 /DNA_ORIENTATION=- /assembly_acc=CAM_ASM_000156
MAHALAAACSLVAIAVSGASTFDAKRPAYNLVLG